MENDRLHEIERQAAEVVRLGRTVEACLMPRPCTWPHQWRAFWGAVEELREALGRSEG